MAVDDLTSTAYILPLFHTGSTFINLNSSNSAQSLTSTPVQGTWVNSRTGSTTHNVYQGGTLAYTIGDGTLGVPTGAGNSIFIGARNEAGSPDFLSSDTIAFAFIGSGMTATQAAHITTYIQTMATSISISGC